MQALVPFIVVCVLAFLAITWGELKGQPRINPIAKTIASLSFFVGAIACGLNGSFYGRTLLLALFWSLVGDLCLIPKGNKPAFIFGIIAFGMAHIGYIVFFRVIGLGGESMLIPLALGLGGAALAFGLLKDKTKAEGGLRLAVSAYVGIILVMVATSIQLGLTLSKLDVSPIGAWCPAIGAVTFAVSDIFVARQRLATASPWNRIIGLPIYYAAQFIFIGMLLPAL